MPSGTGLHPAQRGVEKEGTRGAKQPTSKPFTTEEVEQAGKAGAEAVGAAAVAAEPEGGSMDGAGAGACARKDSWQGRTGGGEVGAGFAESV